MNSMRIYRTVVFFLGEKISNFLLLGYKRFIFWRAKDRNLIFLKNHIQKGAAVFDVGANIGLWTVHFAGRVGAEGLVVAFEPNEETFKILSLNCKGRNQIKCFPFGLSDSGGVKSMLVPLGSPCPSTAAIAESADQIQRREKYETRQISTKKLDDLLPEIKRLDLIKIDVEGHELNVLKGGVKVFTKFKPMIFIEILREKWVDHHPADSEAALFLRSLGYEIGQINSRGMCVGIDQFDPKNENFIFHYGLQDS